MGPGILILTFWILYISLGECCTGNIRPYVDIRCYVYVRGNQNFLRPCPPVTYLNPNTCVLENIPTHTFIDRRPECNRALFGETIQVSSGHTPHSSGGSGVNPSVHMSATHVDQHNLCLHNHSYYRDVFNNAERENCLSPYSVFKQLDYLRKTDHICATTLVKKMAGLNLPSCTCLNRHIFYPYQKTNIYDASCRQDHHFQVIMNTYLTNLPFHHTGATIKCQTRNKVWEDLLRISNMNTRCLDDFISHMHAAYEHNHDPNCYQACQGSPHVSTTTKTTKGATQPSTATITTTTSTTTAPSPSTTTTTTQPTTTNSPSTTTTTTTTPSVTSTTSKPCPSCDENLNCVWNQTCSASESCMVRAATGHGFQFTVHCIPSQDCHFMTTFLHNSEIYCCDDRECLRKYLGM
ncbi:uncharacterized protein LOC134248132 [Saccostrea cucullata]|uniref:uncharacterized protein LOC134248132 n=1 Tax=Saccostrea cuccullata TaxID=36930 RepID=UPI002ED51522